MTRDVLGPQDVQAAKGHVGGPPRLVGRELLGQGVPQAHVDAALDLSLAQLGVDGPAHVVHRHHPLDGPGGPVHHDHLGRVAEGRVDDRVLEALGQRVGPVHPVLPHVVDPDPAAALEGRPAGVFDRARPHQGPPAPRGLAETQLPSGVDQDPHDRRGDAELLDRHLQRHRMDALAHLGPAVAHLDGAVGLETHHRLGHLLEPVAQARVLEAEPQPDRLGRIGDRGLIGGPDRDPGTARPRAPRRP